jgi:hypothetical protein
MTSYRFHGSARPGPSPNPTTLTCQRTVAKSWTSLRLVRTPATNWTSTASGNYATLTPPSARPMTAHSIPPHYRVALRARDRLSPQTFAQLLVHGRAGATGYVSLFAKAAAGTTFELQSSDEISPAFAPAIQLAIVFLGFHAQSSLVVLMRKRLAVSVLP